MPQMGEKPIYLAVLFLERRRFGIYYRMFFFCAHGFP